jgi:RNA polymerase sigma factor (sigma-70 family)
MVSDRRGDQRRGDQPLDELVHAALDGDERAWQALVDRLKGVAWKVINGFRLSDDDRKDAFASTFFRLYDRLHTVRNPERLPGWVATTARNEANTIVRKQRRTTPVGEFDDFRAVPAELAVDDERLAGTELSEALWRAFAELPPEHQALLRLVCADPPLGYEEISRLLDMPHGSIGPTRQRTLERLRRSPQLAPFLHGGLEG